MSLTTFREFMDGHAKPWKAKKAEVLQFWRNLKANMPLAMQAVSEDHTGTRFRADGLRITGSPQFINSVLSRLKDMLQYEGSSDKIRLDVEYREIESQEGDPTPGSSEYVFYAHLVKDEDVPKPPKPPKIKV